MRWSTANNLYTETNSNEERPGPTRNYGFYLVCFASSLIDRVRLNTINTQVQID